MGPSFLLLLYWRIAELLRFFRNLISQFPLSQFSSPEFSGFLEGHSTFLAHAFHLCFFLEKFIIIFVVFMARSVDNLPIGGGGSLEGLRKRKERFSGSRPSYRIKQLPCRLLVYIVCDTYMEPNPCRSSVVVVVVEPQHSGGLASPGAGGPPITQLDTTMYKPCRSLLQLLCWWLLASLAPAVK